MKEKNYLNRQSNFELLRIICIFMILILHYCNSNMGGALNIKNIPEGSFNYYLVRAFESFSIIAVNCFIIITGFFSYNSKKIKVKKIIDLICILLFYNIIIYIFALTMKLQKFDNKSFETFMETMHNGGSWFIVIYIILYMMIPFLNIIIKNINQKQFIFLIIFMLIMFSIYPTFLSNTTVKDNGYGIINFILLYFIGAYISKYKMNSKKAVIYFLIYIIMQTITFFNSIKNITNGNAFAYNSIFNIIGAIGLFLTFSRFNIKYKLINMISQHVLEIYIIHVNVFICTYIWKDLLHSDKYYTSNYITLNLLKSIGLVFIVCLIIDIIRKKIYSCTIEKIIKNNKIYNYELKIGGDVTNG